MCQPQDEPCLPGKARLFVDYKGDFFPCERVNETSSCMHLGNLDTGFDMGNTNSILNIGKLTKDECKNCWAFILCTICAKKLTKKGHYQ